MRQQMISESFAGIMLHRALYGKLLHVDAGRSQQGVQACRSSYFGIDVTGKILPPGVLATACFRSRDPFRSRFQANVAVASVNT